MLDISPSQIPASLAGVRVCLSGSLPEIENSTDQERAGILRFVSQFSAQVFRLVGHIIHSSQLFGNAAMKTQGWCCNHKQASNSPKSECSTVELPARANLMARVHLRRQGGCRQRNSSSKFHAVDHPLVPRYSNQ
jgi:hypothetical protein